MRQALILAALITVVGIGHLASAQDVWVYPVDPPVAPNYTQIVNLTNPTMAQIQSWLNVGSVALRVHGTVSALSGQRLIFNHDDVLLTFSLDSPINWSGSDTWGGFLEINADRIKVHGLEFTILDSSPGKCRAVSMSSASDVYINQCRFNKIADAFNADGTFLRIRIELSTFLNCSDWPDPDMNGGYGVYFEDDDAAADHLAILDVMITQNEGTYAAGQAAVRIGRGEQILMQDCSIHAESNRCLRAYQVENIAIRGCHFEKQSLQINTETDATFASTPTEHVRIEDCTFDHYGIFAPLTIMCGKITRDLRVRNCTGT